MIRYLLLALAMGACRPPAPDKTVADPTAPSTDTTRTTPDVPELPTDDTGTLDTTDTSDTTPICPAVAGDPVPHGIRWEAPAPDRSRDLAWGDWNGDGVPELAVAVYDDESIGNLVYEVVGGNTLQEVWRSSELEDSTAVAWADMDLDGDLDLAVSNVGAPDRIYENVGGNLVPAWAAPDTTRSDDVAWGDVDGDGDPDLVFASGKIPAGVRVLLNQGGVQFTEVWQTPPTDGVEAVDLTDWDGDGDLDLATGGDDPLRVWAGDGQGMFEMVWEHDDWGAYQMDVEWGDWDGDGDPDLAVATSNQPTRVFANFGGELQEAWSGAPGHGAADVDWVDHDLDGDLDLFVASITIGGVNPIFDPDKLLENTGGDLVLAWASPEPVAANAAALADVDGDCLPEIALSHWEAPNRLWEMSP